MKTKSYLTATAIRVDQNEVFDFQRRVLQNYKENCQRYLATKVFKGHFAGNISPEILSSKQYSLIFDCALGTEKIQSGFHALQFYYLIGLRLLHSGNTIQHSFWADDPLQEREIWPSFLETLSSLAGPQLIHYGSHEKLFLKRMKERYGIRNFRIANSIIDRPVNLLSVIFGSIYFPTNSNGLKDIARYLGFGQRPLHD